MGKNQLVLKKLRPAKEEDEKALVVQDGLGTCEWSYQVEEEATDFAFMAFTSNPSSSSSLNFEHIATCKAKLVSSIKQPLQMLHMDLFGSTSVMSINHKKYCLAVTDDFSRDLNEFCRMKGIKREYSNARTLLQNRVAERKNMTLIEADKTMLADSLLPITFWAEAVNTACFVLNKALVTKTHNKTPYELLNGRLPILDFMRPFGCPVTILNTLDPLGKFEGKVDEGFLVGYSVTSQAFRVFNTKTKKVKENLHVRFLEKKPNVVGTGPN
nr:hypothetical protein [Tanacetum cinerariifolium]